jgi:hypothetical protein
MWAAYAKLVRQYAPQALILFDRFHIVQHLNQAVDEVRHSEMQRLTLQEKVNFKRSRWLLLKNPWNLSRDQKDRLSTIIRWNSPIVRAYYLKESFPLFWPYRQPARAKAHLEKWMHAAMRSRLEPFQAFVRLLRSHLEGVLAWTPRAPLQRSRGGHEQQDQVDQPSRLRFPARTKLHRRHLSLLFTIAPAPGGASGPAFSRIMDPSAPRKGEKLSRRQCRFASADFFSWKPVFSEGSPPARTPV